MDTVPPDDLLDNALAIGSPHVDAEREMCAGYCHRFCLSSGGSGSGGDGAGGLGGRGGFGFCGIAVLLFASRFGHDPLLDVPDDGRLVTARI